MVGAQVIAYVPNAANKNIFKQSEVTSKICRWINQVQEFNIDIQITKLVKDQGLAKLMAESNLEARQVNQIDEEHCEVSIETFPWYVDIVYFLRTMSSKKES